MGESRGGRPRRAGGVSSGTRHTSRRAGRRLALEAIFEADFGQRTALSALERRLAETAPSAEASAHAHDLVAVIVAHRPAIDQRIHAAAPVFPVTQLARIDRALLRSAIGELLHCPATPARVAIAEWVALAREYSGEPARRLLNGVLGSISAQETGYAGDPPPTRSEPERGD